MPTYEYKCLECDDRFERFQRMTDPAVSDCPSCGGQVRKLLHPPAIAFKGPGFYVNDYKKPGRTEPESAPATKAESAKTEAPKPAETKTAAA